MSAAKSRISVSPLLCTLRVHRRSYWVKRFAKCKVRMIGPVEHVVEASVPAAGQAHLSE